MTLEFRLRSADRPEENDGEVFLRSRLIRASDESAARLQAVALGRADERVELDAESKPVARTFIAVLDIVESAGPDAIDVSLESLHDHVRAELATNRFRREPEGS